MPGLLFKGLYGFPNSVCMSLNEVVIHGIPTDYVLQEGDIIGLDLGGGGGWLLWRFSPHASYRCDKPAR